MTAVGPSIRRSSWLAGRTTGQAAPDLAAAFICFLYSRTRSRVETSTMSAIERKLPSSPTGADASRHPSAEPRESIVLRTPPAA
jgi:hypothetical protein